MGGHTVIPQQIKLAIVHDYLNQQGGAERVVEVLHNMFPDAPIYTSIVDRSRLPGSLKTADIRPSFMQRLPGVLKHYRWYLPIYPLAFHFMPLDAYDVVISSSSAFAKGVRRSQHGVHVCYCYTPMRYIWGYGEAVANRKRPLVMIGLKFLMFPLLRWWDRATADRPDLYLAISREVADRIKAIYNRTAEVVYPPLRPLGPPRHVSPPSRINGPMLVISRLVSYKRVDLVVEACRQAHIPLRVVGTGPEEARLHKLAGDGDNVTFLGRLSDEDLLAELERCAGVIVPGREDFGLTALEANSLGKPVLAFASGGSLETVIPGVNGVLFREQTVEAIIKGLYQMLDTEWDPLAVMRATEPFSLETYQHRLHAVLDRMVRSQPALASKLGGHSGETGCQVGSS